MSREAFIRGRSLALLAIIGAALFLSLQSTPRVHAATSSDVVIVLAGPTNAASDTIGQNVVYTILVTSTVAADNIVITFPLPAQTTFVSALQFNGTSAYTVTSPAVGANGVITFTTPTTPVVAWAVPFQIVAKVGAAVAPGTLISGTATVTSTTPDPVPGNNTSSTNYNATACVNSCPATASVSTTNHTTNIPSTVNVTGPAQTVTRVLGVLNGANVFDQTASGAPGSPAEQALETSATAALRNAGGAGVTIAGPTQTGTTTAETSTTSGPDTTNQGTTNTVTTAVFFGPGTVLVGPNQGTPLLVPAGSRGYNSNHHAETFFSVVTTVTTSTVTTITVQFVATSAVAAPPTPTPVATPTPTLSALVPPPVLPQVFQNPGAIAALGGVSKPPAQPRPAAVLSSSNAGVQPPALTEAVVLRPPNTGDAGLIAP